MKNIYIYISLLILVAIIVIVMAVNYFQLKNVIKRLYSTGVICVNTTDYDNSFKGNNPGNIMWFGISDFTGESGVTNGTPATFNDVRNGIAAIGQQILIDYKKHGYTSVDQIIGSYAPPIDNDTASYVDSVLTFIQNGANITLQPSSTVPDPSTNPLLLSSIIQGIIFNENSITVPLTFINYCLQNIS